MDEYLYKVKWCPICNQGWIEIVKDIDSQQLFLCCTECETEWENPSDISVQGRGSQDKFGRVEQPSLEEIHIKGWSDIIIK